MNSALKREVAKLETTLKSLASSRTEPPSPVAFAAMLGLELDDWQRDVLASEGKRDLLNCARQSGKSTTAAVLALHAALYAPRSLTLLVSPSLRQSSELFRKLTDFKDRLPEQPALVEDNKLSLSIKHGGRVVSLPSSEQTIRGFSAVDLLIVDEAARVSDALYRGVRPMLAVSNGRLIAMSTPWGTRGWWYQAWAEGGDVWRRVEIPASMVPRISQDFLEEERAAMGEWWYSQEYLCQFREAVDSVFTHEQVMAALSDEVQPLFTLSGTSGGLN